MFTYEQDRMIDIVKACVETTMQHMRKYYEDTHRCWNCGASYAPKKKKSSGDD
jgi:hypothetical protein